MFISPVSFKGCFNVVLNKNGVEKENMDAEVKMHSVARDIGIDAPEYQVVELKYETKGEKADFCSNPITKEHFNNVLKNIYLMDKNKYSHNDLDIEHVFYDKDGNVEFDCFRFAKTFDNEKVVLPEFMAQTNQLNYESASLALYLEAVPDIDDKKEIVKNYLSTCAKFHQKRSDFIYQGYKKADEMYTREMMSHELTKAKALKNIDDTKVNLFLQKLDFLGKQRKAFTEWDEGDGACGHEFNSQRRINAIPMYFEAIKSAIFYSQYAQKMSDFSRAEDKKYYENEAKVGQFFANTYISWVKGMANWNFVDVKMQNNTDVEVKEMIDKQFDEIIKADFSDKESAMEEYLELYYLYV